MNWNLSGYGNTASLTYTNTANLNTLTGAPRRPIVQAPSTERGKYVCSECEITYMVPKGSKAVCPLCDQKKVTEQVRHSLHQTTNQLHMLTNRYEQVVVQLDELEAMKVAFETISVEDLTFVKSVIYRWQADRSSVALKPLHGSGRGRKKRSSKVGFVAIFRGSEAEEHLCNSVGGLALAAYLDEATALLGPIKAFETFVRAGLHHLTTTAEPMKGGA